MHVLSIGIKKEAYEANNDSRFNGNNVASIPITKHFIILQTLPPHLSWLDTTFPSDLLYSVTNSWIEIVMLV